ncbi:hypothetical protein REJ26_002346 [Providencia stuartii]|uniref:DUF6338 family protein n=1 Tax=Providencia TaxID=586 RepID=UPI0027F0DD77|nr:DUF6338 family protein [Providencia sp. 2023EL-00965]ELR5300712.1 hypothetical protein [Providencia stuartii]MDW7589665.1 DUF6338 family protein [Providencia sp. 2023EL-00965]
MDVLNQDKLILFFLFIVPGFISLKIYNLLQPSNYIESSKLVIDAITYSGINYAFLAIPIYFVEKSQLISDCPFLYYLFYVFVFIIFPVILPFIFLRIRKSEWCAKLPHPTGKAWDYVFQNAPESWIKVTLKDGTIIGGAYSGDSFASSSPEPMQLYLSEHWIMNKDGGFERKVNSTSGILILNSDIVTVEFFKK